MKTGFFKQSELIKKSDFVSVVAKCGACGLFKTCKSPKMKVDGKGRRKILLLGEAPGADEDAEGKPFVGKSGRFLESALRRHGIDMRRDCWITNALICRPPKNEIKDEDNKVAYCRPNVMNAVKKLKPEIILTFGQIAVKSLIGHIWKEQVGSMTRWVGWRIPSQQLNAWICPLWHPSFLLREQSPVLDLWFDCYIERAVGLKGRPWKEIPDYEKQVEVVLDPEIAAGRIASMIEAGGKAAFDYETNMLKPDSRKAQIVCASICFEGKDTISFPWINPAIGEMEEFLRSKRIAKIGTNIKFEDRWTRTILRFGVKNWIWDTMLASHILDCRKGGINSIKFQSLVRMGVGSYNDAIEPFLEAKTSNSLNRVHEIDLKRLCFYCGLDSLFEFQVALRQMEELYDRR